MEDAFKDALKLIIGEGRECEAIKFLSECLDNKLHYTNYKLAEHRNSLIAIRKINAAKYKDEAIDNLSEPI